MRKSILFLYTLFFLPLTYISAQELRPVPFGDFEQWVVRQMKESFILGGDSVCVYAVAPTDTIRGNIPYSPAGGSQWGSSNVMARIMGIVKTSNTVYPEKRSDGAGWCARLDTKLAECKVLGMVNITVLASGSLFLGHPIEPIHSANDPYKKINMGVPFSSRPKYLCFDYKAVVSQDTTVTHAKISKVETIPGRDMADIYVYLQKRWEDADGTLHIKRVATMRQRIDKSTDGWVIGHREKLHYGDITSSDYYKEYMHLMNGDTFYTMNSSGKLVPIVEEGWAEENETPTHIVMMFSSGCLGAYIGALGNSLWIDNIAFEY